MSNQAFHFRNEPLLDFSEPHNREGIATALSAVASTLRSGPYVVHPIIAGERVSGGEVITRNDPSDTSAVIGKVHLASVQDSERAMNSLSASDSWRNSSAESRIEIVRKLAGLLQDNKSFLTALIIREAGKPWREADGDVAEAIDFCNYYAAQMSRFAHPALTEQIPGEDNFYLYQPRGIAAVISPWNFPLAITCGMTVAALVTGNSVVLKPAEQAGVIAHEFARLVLAAGAPATAFAFLPGRGEVVGRFLVAHPSVSLIAVTGSRAVGLEILETASRIAPGQRLIKRVITELGGKNAIIVDDDADMDDAIRGVVQSAFGYAGQKCSACSRLIVVGAGYDAFLSRLTAATADLIVGPACDPATMLGPVIDQESGARISRTIEGASRTLKLLVSTPLPHDLTQQGVFVPATIFRDVPRDHPVWTEIFGPVLACINVPTFDAAIEAAIDSDYALTGGVFSRHPAHLRQAHSTFRVGNLYLNRSITGALVGRQPFGGFALSGIGSKAGGPDYLLQFMEPRVVTENTMRRGFASE